MYKVKKVSLMDERTTKKIDKQSFLREKQEKRLKKH